MNKNLLLLSLFVFLCMCVTPLIAQTSTTQMALIYAKTNSNASYKLYLSRILTDTPPAYEAVYDISIDKFGGRTDMKADSTGYYHTVKKNNRWWLVAPNGNLYINKGINAIYPGTDTACVSAFNSKFGNNNVWFDSTRNMIKRYGFEGAGCWSKPLSYYTSYSSQDSDPMNYTVFLNWMANYGAGRTTDGVGHPVYPYNCIFVFEKAFQTYCNTKAQTLTTYKYDKNLLGYFSDNELPFYKASLNNFLHLGTVNSSDENYLATVKWLSDNNYTAADTVNATVQSQFQAYVGKTYYSIVYNAIKSVDANHLYLGSRVHLPEARDNATFMSAIGPYVDVFTVNYYGVWTPDTTSMATWANYSGKPFLVTEFYTKAESSGLSNSQGAGWIVKNQTDRGYEYQNFTLALLESRNCVGWHWFKYMDDPAVPITNGANKGLVTNDYQPYTECLSKMSELNKNVYYIADGFDGVNRRNNTLTNIHDMVLFSFEVYPTIIKSNDIVTIYSENPISSSVQIQLFDITGKNKTSEVQLIENKYIKITNLNPGIYLIKYNSETFQTTKKIVII